MTDESQRKRLICMMGLPRSGKSTVARELSATLGVPIVNRDSIRLALHGQRYESLAEPMVRAIALIMVRALFHAGHDTVIADETNLKETTRSFWQESLEWATFFLHVDTPKDVCLARAADMNDEQIQPVIESMHAYTEPLDRHEKRFDVSCLPNIRDLVADCANEG